MVLARSERLGLELVQVTRSDDAHADPAIYVVRTMADHYWDRADETRHELASRDVLAHAAGLFCSVVMTLSGDGDMTVH